MVACVCVVVVVVCVVPVVPTVVSVCVSVVPTLVSVCVSVSVSVWCLSGSSCSFCAAAAAGSATIHATATH
jgi:hypothetical protein